MEKKREELEIFSKKNTSTEDEMRYPLYRECFQNAIFSILSNLYAMRDNCKHYFRDDEAYRYSFSRLPDNANNIYAFLGPRGSGKTTAINEFGRILRELSEEEKKEWIKEAKEALNLKQDKKNLEFVVLDTIDASLLTDKEDFVELVLSQLFAIVEEERSKIDLYSRQQSSSCVAQLSDAFINAYNSYRNISREEAGRELGESVTTILKNMPSGPNARWAISQLLTSFFEFVGKGKETKRYLVIIIDDLDLNIGYGYKLLEQIHKYLADPRIIVLIAADYGQLSLICEYYFKNQYSQNQYSQNREEDNQDSAVELSKEYLLKAIPIANRIYMPDSREFVKKYVEIKADKEKADSDNVRDVKSFVMNKVVEKLGIYYDLNGTKKHFAVPNTVRELVNYNDFLSSLNFIEWQDGKVPEEQMHWYDLNHARMNQDITSRMAYQLLSHKQQKVFQVLLNKNIINRAKYVVDLCKNWRGDTYVDRADNIKYRYADLVEALYHLGRDDYRDKGLVHCIIAFLTSEMTREYYHFCAVKNEKDSKKCLKSFLGDSFGNKWLGEMIPRIMFDSKKGIVEEWGYIERAQINLWQLGNEFNINQKNESLYEEEVINQLIKDSEENKYFEVLGMLMLFLSEHRISDGHIMFPEMRFEIDEISTVEEGVEEQKIRGYSISFETPSATFDIFGFIGKEWNNTQINEISSKIVEKIKKSVQEVAGKGKEIQEKYAELEKLVREQLGEWLCDNFLAFPFYSLDMSYNVLKRARKKGSDMGGEIKVEQIYDTMKRAYGYIAAELYFEEEKYKENSIKGLEWFDNFVNSPFIENFGISYPEEMRDSFNLINKQGTTEEKTENREKLKDKSGHMSEEMQNKLNYIIKSMILPDQKDDTPN